MEEVPPENGFQKFLKTKYAAPIGIILALALCILMFYFGLFASLCGMGILLIGIVLFIIPKIFGLKSLKAMIAVGVVFFLVATAIGGLAVSKSAIDANDNYSEYNDGGFSNVDFTDNGNGTVTVTVDHATSDKTILLRYGETTFICYGIYNFKGTEITMTETDTAGTYSATVNMSSGKLYAYNFGEKVGEGDASKTVSKFYSGLINDSQLTYMTLYGNAYYVGLASIMYLMIVLITTWMRKNLEKTRARMEAEGRLYPQGYGRCKECGSIVLPGETCCRKCGAYIDVPDDMRAKKVEMVECSECGAEVPADAKVCPKCGANFDEGEEVVIVDENGHEIKDEDNKPESK